MTYRKKYNVRWTPRIKRVLILAAVFCFILGAMTGYLVGWALEPGEVETPVVKASYTPPVTSQEAAYVPDEKEVDALARMLYGEARGISSDTEKAACVWVVLNRVDDPRFPDTVMDVLEAPNQFVGYSLEYHPTEELKALAADVLTRYHAEKQGKTNVGRVLPRDYCWFVGDGYRNYFTNTWRGSDEWDWSLESPYED